MIGEILILGFVLSLDNFRTTLALGALRLRWPHALQVALMFGLWDALAPLVGMVTGGYLSQAVGSTAEYIGAIALGAYGLYLLAHAWRTPEPEESDQRWALFGLSLPLSMDNLVAGTGLGLLGISPWIAPPLFGAITVLVSLVGLQLGRAASQLVRIRPDLVSGVALILMAPMMGLGFL
jgi:putative Mn2+ efflux pump MntP